MAVKLTVFLPSGLTLSTLRVLAQSYCDLIGPLTGNMVEILSSLSTKPFYGLFY